MFPFRKSKPDEPMPVGFKLQFRGRLYAFDPKPDITTHELAQVFDLMSTFLVNTLQMTRKVIDIDGWWDEVGPGVQRHFTEEDAP